MKKMSSAVRDVREETRSNRLVRKMAAAAALALSSLAAAQTAPLVSDQVRLDIDSGVLQPRPDRGDRVAKPEIVFFNVVTVDGADWLRLQFDSVILAGDPGVDGSFLRLTAVQDGAIQTLNRTTLAQWRNTSAYFNGDRVIVELLAYPGTGENRVQVASATVGLPDEGPMAASICDGVDLRELSSAAPDARSWPTGCTAFLIDQCEHCFMTAGHCVVTDDLYNPERVQVVEFNVPLSNADGSKNFSHPDDQYPTDPASFHYHRSGCERDWAFFGAFPNSNTGLTPAQAQGPGYTLASAAPQPSGQDVRIRGYGTTSSPVPPQWNVAQKTHSGPYISMTDGTRIRHRADTTGGNSGSAVYDHSLDMVIGVHTCAGCTSSGGANNATAIHHEPLQAALAQPLGITNINGPCSNGVGNCHQANGSGGCSNGDCCELVCAQIPGCCTIGWIGACADLAATLCSPGLLYDNGTLVSHINGHTAGYDRSATVGDQANGFNWAGSNRVADDFTVPEGETWNVQRVIVYGYSTNWQSLAVSPVGSVTVQVFNGSPASGGSVVFGNQSTNRLIDARFAGIYRTSASNNSHTGRALFELELDVQVTLEPGQYWLSVGSAGSPGVSSGPWVPGIPASYQTYGNALHFVSGGWQQRQEDFAFTIRGDIEAQCPADITGDGVVDVSDLLALLGAWGPCAGNCAEDLNGDGIVDVSDLLLLLGEWGTCD